MFGEIIIIIGKLDFWDQSKLFGSASSQTPILGATQGGRHSKKFAGIKNKYY